MFRFASVFTSCTGTGFDVVFATITDATLSAAALPHPVTSRTMVTRLSVATNVMPYFLSRRCHESPPSPWRSSQCAGDDRDSPKLPPYFVRRRPAYRACAGPAQALTRRLGFTASQACDKVAKSSKAPGPRPYGRCSVRSAGRRPSGIGTVTSQGSAHARFTRAVQRGHLFAAEMAAREMGRLSPSDALSLCILYRAGTRSGLQ